MNAAARGMEGSRQLWHALGDPTRLRLLALLMESELSVSELQAIACQSQSLISAHLGVLRKSGLVRSRREGKSAYYESVAPPAGVPRAIWEAALATLPEVPGVERDREGLKEALKRRRQAAQKFFNRMAGRMGRAYCPGRAWAAVGPMLSQLVPECDIADLGAGEGWLTFLLAQRARRVIAVDHSPKMVEFGRQQILTNRIHNVEYRLGDLEAPPIPEGSMDCVIFSQALHHAERPARAVETAAGLLRPGGRLVVLDLLEHRYERAREIYHDRWLGFRESDLRQWLTKAGMRQVMVQVLEAEEKAPRLKPLLAGGVKPAQTAG